MKKVIITIMGLFMIVMLSNNVYAGDVATTTAGADVVVPDGGNGPGFTYVPSPGTIMDVVSIDTDFTIVSTSTKTTGGIGMIYALISASSAIYQINQTTDGEYTGFEAPAAGTQPDGMVER